MSDRIAKIESHLDMLHKIVAGFENTLCAKNDPYGILLVLFFQRFLEHSQSVRNLKRSRDHILIARSIIEGGVILKWVLNSSNKEERKKRAIKYFNIDDITLIERLEAQGKKDNPKYKEIVEAAKKRILSREDGLLTEKDRENLQNDMPLSFKQFIVRLTGKTLGKIIKDDPSLDNRIYERNYNNMCGFHHWNVFYMLFTISDEGRVEYGKTNDHDYEQSLTSAFFVLGEVAQHLSIHARLDKEDEIRKLGDGLIEVLTRK